MGLLKAIALGVLQGLTEFLPISSSGHLVIVQQLFPTGIEHPVAFDVCLHFGTLLAVVVYFRADLLEMARALFTRADPDLPVDPDADYRRRWIWLLGVATLPLTLVGLSLHESLEEAFGSIEAAGAALFVTACLLLIASRTVHGKRGPEQMNLRDALTIGVFQAVALVPGISRSGATITGGLLRGLDPSTAARFSFLLSVPAILGAMVLSFADVTDLLATDPTPILAGVAAAAITGWLAIEVMMRAVKLGRLAPFAVYCVILGSFALLRGGG